jgi:DNA-directed RNA polymerase subunit M/transcription elongation factor TFIIS
VENHPPELWRERASDAESLPMTRTSSRAALRCDRCGSGEVLSVSMNMEDGGIQFRTCTDCEATWWERDGLRIERTDALTAIPRR